MDIGQLWVASARIKGLPFPCLGFATLPSEEREQELIAMGMHVEVGARQVVLHVSHEFIPKERRPLGGRRDGDAGLAHGKECLGVIPTTVILRHQVEPVLTFDEQRDLSTVGQADRYPTILAARRAGDRDEGGNLLSCAVEDLGHQSIQLSGESLCGFVETVHP